MLDQKKMIKSIFLFGLIFSQLSNFVFWIEEAIPIEEFFIFDMYLICSLFFIILQELKIISSDHVISHYMSMLGGLNNFIITLFFLCWGVFFPEKDLAFIKKIGLNGNLQIVFDFISLAALRHIFIKSKDKIAHITIEKILIAELFLIIALFSTLLVF